MLRPCSVAILRNKSVRFRHLSLDKDKTCKSVTQRRGADYAEPAQTLARYGDETHMNPLKSVLLFCTASLTVAWPLRANVVTDWNGYASTAIVKNAGTPPAASSVYFAYAALAVYDAVNSITGQYRPYCYYGTTAPTASLESAAVAAAHRVLVNYFPTQQTDLDAKFAASLAALGVDPTMDPGVAAGEAAAAALIAIRTGDGAGANVSYTPGSGPGVWIPTPPAYAAAATPWLAKMRPFTMSTAADFRPDGPTPLNSEGWKRDYDLTRLWGGQNSTIRSASQSEIGLFWTENTAQQYARAFTYLVNNYKLNVSDSARMMAIAWTAYADSGIACWDGKFTYSFWRPVTAIPAGGGNADLQADPAWMPLGVTPNHPEYPAAHGAITGSVTTAIAAFFGTTKVHVVMDSTAFTDGVHTHTYEDTRDWMDEVFWARIYAGFHFYHSLQTARELGTAVAQQMLRTHFTPQRSGLIE